MKRTLKTELDREMILAYIKRLDITKSYSVDVTENRKKRSIPQNSLYWLWLTCIEYETGTDRNELHELFKDEFIIPDVIEVLGRQVEVKTTTNKDTLQFKTYLDKIQVLASVELGITLPEPRDKTWEDFYSFYIEKL